jgi:hypothetical protein
MATVLGEAPALPSSPRKANTLAHPFSHQSFNRRSDKLHHSQTFA